MKRRKKGRAPLPVAQDTLQNPARPAQTRKVLRTHYAARYRAGRSR